ncbi:MAG: T9SS type A sorting domain-containing protein [Chitinophagaceae bacterium]
MKRQHLILLFLYISFAFSAFAQTNISGIVNNYYKVTAINTTTSVLKLDNTTGLNASDKVMLIQMKGITVETANNTAFGSVSNQGNAGNYEINNICLIRNDSVWLTNSLVKTYDVIGKIQLVRIPRYESANVIASLTASPWDSTTGKGGVLAISVANTLTLNAPVTAEAKGFKGGIFISSGGTFGCVDHVAPNYYYNAATADANFGQLGAYKGESVANLTSQYSGGRGAAANGGGGGNNHNNGGGGGSNITAGGSGGGNTSASTCEGNYPGRGGYALNNSSAKIFLGGGGGSGHGNNTSQAGGGTGGGIIFIQTDVLISNGQVITANGSNGSNTFGDGGSGGGAGGSLIMNIETYADVATIEAKGGGGGTVDNENITQSCFGEGGGGSGGAIYFKNTQPAGTLSVAGGVKGDRINTVCGGSSPGSAGNNGMIISNNGIIESFTISQACLSALPVELIYFKASLNKKRVDLKWELANTETVSRFVVLRKTHSDINWKELHLIYPQENVMSYTATDTDLGEGIVHYLLKIIEHDESVSYSTMSQINWSKQNKLRLYPNPALHTITLTGAFYKNDQLVIYDVSGGKVFEKKLLTTVSFIEQNISFLEKGVYMIRIRNLSASFVVQ